MLGLRLASKITPCFNMSFCVTEGSDSTFYDLDEDGMHSVSDVQYRSSITNALSI